MNNQKIMNNFKKRVNTYRVKIGGTILKRIGIYFFCVVAFGCVTSSILYRGSEKLKEIRFRVKPEEFEKYEEAAKKAGYKSMRQFYIDAINEKIQKIQN